MTEEQRKHEEQRKPEEQESTWQQRKHEDREQERGEQRRKPEEQQHQFTEQKPEDRERKYEHSRPGEELSKHQQQSDRTDSSPQDDWERVTHSPQKQLPESKSKPLEAQQKKEHHEDSRLPEGMQPISKEDAKAYREHVGELYANEQDESILDSKIMISGILNEKSQSQGEDIQLISQIKPEDQPPSLSENREEPLSPTGYSKPQQDQGVTKSEEHSTRQDFALEFQPSTIEDDRSEKPSPFKSSDENRPFASFLEEQRRSELAAASNDDWEKVLHSPSRPQNTQEHVKYTQEKTQKKIQHSKEIHQLPEGMQPITKEDAKAFREHVGDLYANEHAETVLDAKIVMTGILNEKSQQQQQRQESEEK